MSNYKDLYDYGLTGANIEVWPTETDGPAPITIDAAAFFAWLYIQGYIADFDLETTIIRKVALHIDDEGFPVFETFTEWWHDPRVISQPGKFTSTTNLLDALLCEYLNDPANERFTDCRTVDQLPTEFLTAVEKLAKKLVQ